MIRVFLAKGKRGIVYTAVIGKRRVVIKEKRNDSKVDTIANEAKWLKILNRKKIGPEILQFKNGRVVMEYIHGKPIEEWTESTKRSKNDREIISEVLKDVLRQCYFMDKMQVNKLEMHRPYKHIIVGFEGEGKKGKWPKPRLVDFERCRKTNNPKNVTQFCQYITSKRYGALLNSKGIFLNKGKIIKVAKEYKKSYSKDVFDNIIGLINI